MHLQIQTEAQVTARGRQARSWGIQGVRGIQPCWQGAGGEAASPWTPCCGPSGGWNRQHHLGRAGKTLAWGPRSLGVEQGCRYCLDLTAIGSLPKTGGSSVQGAHVLEGSLCGEGHDIPCWGSLLDCMFWDRWEQWQC